MINKSQNTGSIQLSRDKKLVKSMLTGDEQALRVFFDEYFPRLYRYALHRLRNEADVDDVVQTVLAQAARRIETYRGESTLLTWLIQICRHEISRQLHAGKRESDMMSPFLNDELLRSVVESMEAVGYGASPEAGSKRDELISLVQFSLDQLPERYSAALELKYIEEFSSKEIAEKLGISDDATQSLLARARRAFREVCGEALHAAR